MHPLPIFPFGKGSWQTDLKGGWSKRVFGGHLYILEAPQSANWNSSPGHNLLSALHIFIYHIHIFWYRRSLISWCDLKVPGNGESAIELIDFNLGLSRVIKTMATNVFWVFKDSLQWSWQWWGASKWTTIYSQWPWLDKGHRQWKMLWNHLKLDLFLFRALSFTFGLFFSLMYCRQLLWDLLNKSKDIILLVLLYLFRHISCSTLPTSRNSKVRVDQAHWYIQVYGLIGK